MENKTFCQSCSMPLDNDKLLGTEKDGSKSHEYCTYCYQKGAFINPEMTLDEMRNLVKAQMEKMKIDSSVIRMAVNSLPGLKRWKMWKSEAVPLK
jgi:predicted amidophosphoribosyltransferase